MLQGVKLGLDGLNRMDSPNFFLWVEFRKTPKGPPPTRQARAFLEARLRTLNPDSLGTALSMYQDLHALPGFHFREAGWEIDFYPIPKSPEARGEKGMRTVGVVSDGVHRIDAITPIRNAVHSKATRYGHLDTPYVIAVNYAGEQADDDDVVQALFGSLTCTYNTTDGAVTPRREPNGCWRPTRNTRVSGVLFFKGLRGHYIPGASVRLYHNPWAKYPCTGLLCRFPQAVVRETGRLEPQEGALLTEVLGLPSDWPGDEHP